VRCVPLLAAALLLTACPRERPTAHDATPTKRPDLSVPVARYEHCTTRTANKPLSPVRLFGAELTPATGSAVLRARSAPAGHRMVLGVLGDTREALPATLEQLQRLAQQFRRASVSAVVVLGGIDTSFEGIKQVLAPLRAAGPVLALPGDRESRSGFCAAAETERATDLVRVRALDVGWIGLVAVPGYHLPHHLMAREQGCSYDDPDIRGLLDLVQQLPALRLLVAHGPPRGEGAQAVDRALGQVNIGDPLLRRLMQEAQIGFGLFAHVHESVGHATTVDGARVRPMTWSSSLLLNVGAADSVPHENLDGSWSRGNAAIVELTDRCGVCGSGAPDSTACACARYRMLDLARLPRENPDAGAGPLPPG